LGNTHWSPKMTLKSLHKLASVAEKTPKPLTLLAFLTRLIWLCVLPLVLLAIYLAVDNVRTLQAKSDEEAEHLVENVATAIDLQIQAQIGSLQVLAASPLLDDPSRFNEFYTEAKAFRNSFGGNVILADLSTQMLFNTHAPFGEALPKLPRPRSNAAVPTVLKTGKPAVGDTFIGTVVKKPMIAIAVPVERDDKIRFILLNVIESRQFQKPLDEVSLPAEWSLTVLDGKDEVIARRSQSETKDSSQVGMLSGRFVAKSGVSHWSVVLEIPPSVYRRPVITAATGLALTILMATLLSVLGGRMASARLANSVVNLAESPSHPSRPVIAEIELARGLLREAEQAREAAVEALRQREETLRLFIEHSPAALAMFDRDMRYLAVSRRWMKDYRLGDGDILGKSDYDIFREIPDRWKEDHRRGLAGAVVRVDEDSFERMDGSVQWLRREIRPWYTSDGGTGGIVIFSEDITDRKLAEAALKKGEERLRLALDAAKAGAWEWDLRTNRNFWSDELWALYGLEPYSCEPSYEAWLKTVRHDDRAALEQDVREISSKGVELNTEWRVEAPNDGERWLMARGRPIYNYQGQAVSYIGIVMDITERKRAEHELSKTILDLERSNKELEQFAYVASHDLQEPLRMVASYTQLLAERYGEQLDDKAKKFIEYAVDGAVRMQRLILDLLTLSRVTTRGSKIQLVDSNVALGMAVASLGESIRESNALVTNDELPQVMADQTQLAQVFQNLISNAIKFRDANPPLIHISARADGPNWLFSVKDNGIGIDPQYKDRIFVIFQRLHTREEYPGTGIGLALCQRIVNRHGGEIWLDSNPGEGSTFYFTIPKITKKGQDDGT
jgi:PAS domain S-box-containing protein